MLYERQKDTPLPPSYLKPLTIEHFPINFGALDTYEAERAMWSLNMASRVAELDLFEAKRILDFGAGQGGPTWALARLAAMNGGNVEAVEEQQRLAEEIVRSGVLPADKVYARDGIEYLHEAGRSHKAYDLITAFRLGPDDEGHLSRDLIEASLGALADGGKLLITSDWTTMEVARKVCEGMGKKGVSIKGFGTPEARFTYDALVVPKQ